VIVLDTHAWIWYLDSPSKLSTSARQAIEGARREKTVYVCSISTWEIYMLVSGGRLAFSVAAEVWVARSERLSFLNFIPVDNEIARLAVDLPGSFHNDPADRMIVATARFFSAPLVSKDTKINQYEHVQTIW